MRRLLLGEAGNFAFAQHGEHAAVPGGMRDRGGQPLEVRPFHGVPFLLAHDAQGVVGRVLLSQEIETDGALLDLVGMNDGRDLVQLLAANLFVAVVVEEIPDRIVGLGNDFGFCRRETTHG